MITPQYKDKSKGRGREREGEGVGLFQNKLPFGFYRKGVTKSFEFISASEALVQEAVVQAAAGSLKILRRVVFRVREAPVISGAQVVRVFNGTHSSGTF